MRYFIKFGYIGTDFTGFQKGNGARSVEDSILAKLQSIGVTSPISSAARTDREVSAIGNVFSVEYNGNIKNLMALLNKGSASLFYLAYSPVESSLWPRHSSMKVYRYLCSSYSKRMLEPHLRKFTGTHDFSHFSRRDGRNPVRTIDRIDIVDYGTFTAIDFWGKSFIWQQIRRIMGFVFSQIEEERDDDPFSYSRAVKPAPPQQLILLDVRYPGIVFTPFREKSLERILIEKTRRSFYTFLLFEHIISSLDSIYTGKS